MTASRLAGPSRDPVPNFGLGSYIACLGLGLFGDRVYWVGFSFVSGMDWKFWLLQDLQSQEC